MFGLDSVCPGQWINLRANRKADYERTTDGNQLRTVDRPPSRDSAPATDDSCAMVVYPDATGRGPRVGSRTTGQARAGLYALGRVGAVIPGNVSILNARSTDNRNKRLGALLTTQLPDLLQALVQYLRTLPHSGACLRISLSFEGVQGVPKTAPPPQPPVSPA